jgi:hypothetical protein
MSNRPARVEVRQRLLREREVLRDFEPDDLRAAARPPRAPAVRTDMRPLPERDVDVRPVDDLRAVARPPLAPAFFFCAVVPARPPRAPAALTVIVPRREDVLRALVLRAADLRAVVFRAVVLRAAVFRAVVFRAVVLRAGDRRPVVFRAVVFRAPVELRAVVLRAVDLRAVDLRLPDVFRDAVLRLDEPLPRADDDFRELDELEDEREDEDDFVSPFAARSLLTVRAAISFARFVDRPCFFSESLMCSY